MSVSNGSILEYIVHGEYAWNKSDTNSTYGAWWTPLRTLAADHGLGQASGHGKEVVEEKC